jgi:hypothetical protein
MSGPLTAHAEALIASHTQTFEQAMTLGVQLAALAEQGGATADATAALAAHEAYLAQSAQRLAEFNAQHQGVLSSVSAIASGASATPAAAAPAAVQATL